MVVSFGVAWLLVAPLFWFQVYRLAATGGPLPDDAYLTVFIAVVAIAFAVYHLTRADLETVLETIA